MSAEMLHTLARSVTMNNVSFTLAANSQGQVLSQRSKTYQVHTEHTYNEWSWLAVRSQPRPFEQNNITNMLSSVNEQYAPIRKGNKNDLSMIDEINLGS
jgi:hypothetical protein